MNKIRLMFCCAMRGPHILVSEEELREIMDWLKNRLGSGFELVTDHQTRDGAIAEDDAEPNVYDRENKRIGSCTSVVCEVSDGSGGVGGEAVYAVDHGIPVLLLAHSRVPEEKISKYLRDMAESDAIGTDVVYQRYSNAEDASSIVKAFGIAIRDKSDRAAQEE